MQAPRTVTTRTIGKLEELFGIDLRSLALFRIGTGLILIADLLLFRLPDVEAFYSDLGVLPRIAALGYGTSWQYWSLHLFSGLVEVQYALFLAALLFGLALVLGWRTRLSTFFSWLLLVSANWRNPLLLNSGDVLLQMMLFWSIFLPLGDRWSIDARRSTSKLPKLRVVSVASGAILLQILLIYLFTYQYKSHPIWREEYTGVYYALSNEAFTTRWGFILLGYPELCRLLTIVTLFLEGCGPLLIFVPFFIGPIRTLLTISFIAFHLGIYTTMEIGLFGPTCIVAWLIFLPSWFWDRFAVAGKTDPEDERLPPQFAPGKFVLLRSVLVFVIFFNIVLTNTFQLLKQTDRIPVWSFWLSYVSSTWQEWNMFSPFPKLDDGWFIVTGKFSDGSSWDLVHDSPVDRSKPVLVSASYKNKLWQNYLYRMKDDETRKLPQYYGLHLCAHWNLKRSTDKRMVAVEVEFAKQVTFPNYLRSAPEYELVVAYLCPQRAS